jgi:hypothetical protein
MLSRQDIAAMHLTHPTLLHTLFTLRSLELQAEAERRRIIREARAASADHATLDVRRQVERRLAGSLPTAAPGAIVLPGGTPTR